MSKSSARRATRKIVRIRAKRVSDENGETPTPVIVTPALATRWLEGNTHNRPLNQRWIDFLADEIRNGNWRLTHQGVAFDVDGTLIDGQHRLWAIIEAGEDSIRKAYKSAGVGILVTRGCPRETQLVIDTHKPRSTAHALTLTDNHGAVTQLESNTLKRMLKGLGRWEARSHAEEDKAFTKHKRAIRFAISCFPTRLTRIVTPTVCAVLARASYEHDHERIKEFADVMLNGQGTTALDQMVIRLRDHMLRDEIHQPGKAKQDMIYAKVERALLAWIERRPLRRLESVQSEQFLLPEENVEVIS